MPPKYLGNARSGITTCLNKLLLKYHESIRGVLLAFSDVKLARAHGCLLEEDATINFPVTLKALVLRVTEGSILRARVNKLSPDHMGLLLCGLINVSIASAKMPKYSFKTTKTTLWVSRGQPSISVGTEIEFRVERVQKEDGIISIEGAEPRVIPGAKIVSAESSTNVSAESSTNVSAESSTNTKRKLKDGKSPKVKKKTEEEIEHERQEQNASQ